MYSLCCKIVSPFQAIDGESLGPEGLDEAFEVVTDVSDR